MPCANRHPRLAARVAFAFALALVSRHALAAEPSPADLPSASAAPPVVRPLVYLEWQGELRLRGENMSGVRVRVPDDVHQTPYLDLRRDGEPASFPNEGMRLLQTADLRFRLRPVLHVGEWSEVNSQLDLGRGVVLGGSPDTQDVIARFTGFPGQTSLRDGIAVRRLWVHARLFGFGEVEVGRMGDHFGMGMLRNAGGGIAGDFQDDVDRVAVRAELFGMRLMVARDSLAALPRSGWGVDAKPTELKPNPTVYTVNDSVQRALQDATDVSRWVAEAHGGKLRGEQGLMWSAAMLYSTQELAMRAEHEPAIDFTQPCRTGDCVSLITRNARFLVPEFALDWRGRLGSRPLRIQAEGALQYGTFDNIGNRSAASSDSGTTASVDSELTIIAGGLASRATLRDGRSEFKLDAGFASGAADGGFGVNDTDNLRRGGLTSGTDYRTFLSGFHFHREFRIDGLMFRDIVGAVANTVYVKPAWRWLFLEGETTLGLEGSVLAAIAASPQATPGKGTFLGIEPEVTLDWSGRSGLGGFLRGSLFVPGAAFATNGQDAGVATRVEAIWRVTF